MTMTLGNLAALQQTNLKRLLAYSSVAHAGYVLMGFVVLSDEGLRAVLFYMIIYYLMNIGAFLVGDDRRQLDRPRGPRGLARSRPGAAAPSPAVAMAIFLFSLAGIPPLAGFIGKFYLFAAVIRRAVLCAGPGRRREQRRVASTTTLESCARCSSIFRPAAKRP